MPKKKLFSHKNFENPCRDFNLVIYWKMLHNHYNWRVSTFEPLHGISKFLWLNNFCLGAMKKWFYDLFKKCLRLSQIHDLCVSRQKNLIFSKGHREKFDFLCFLPSPIMADWYVWILEIEVALGICHSFYPMWSEGQK